VGNRRKSFREGIKDAKSEESRGGKISFLTSSIIPIEKNTP